MAVLKCTVCGGELDVNADLSVGVCKFCDSIITIPKELDRKGNLYNRAIFLRQNNEFDKALTIYEDILKENNLDAEAHWGLVLSKFGIEYVLDPKTQERIPTCHRTQTQSILCDPDYLAAIELSDIEAQRVIENEAKRINGIQTKIIELSKKEKPYDIFICYKETDEFGNRTEDSVLAQDMYNELQKKGYRTFFARKTLEKKLGSEYEPIIFSALNTAKVMVVLGTKAEYLNSTWVKNEWSRFISISKGTNRTIIPAYRGMSPYELPAELSPFQSLDMSKIGFMQDLTDGIERCTRFTANNDSVEREFTKTPYVASLERLLQNGSTYLKLKNYVSAKETYTNITKEYPEDYRGWWGLIVSETENFYKTTTDQTSLNVWFGYVKQLSSPDDFKELEKTYVNYTKENSKVTASEDIEDINNLIVEYHKEIDKDNKELLRLENQIKEREKKWKGDEKYFLNLIKKYKFEITANENKRKDKRTILNIAFVILALWFIAFLMYDTVGIGVSMFLFPVWIFLFYSRVRFFPPNSCLDYEMNESNKSLNNSNIQYDIEKTEYEKNIAKLTSAIEEIKKDILFFEDQINKCNMYINLDKDKISELFFSVKCNEFGVDIPYDNQIKEYREEVLKECPYLEKDDVDVYDEQTDCEDDYK